MRLTTGTTVVRRSVDPLAHFAILAAGDNKLFVPTDDGVEAFEPS